MKISQTMLRDHLRGVTVNYFSHHNLAPEDIDDYTPFAEHVRQTAERRGDLPWLKLGLEHVLIHREESCEHLNGGIYPFGDDDLRDLIEIVWEALWPDEQLPDESQAPEIEFEEMSTEDWNRFKETDLS